MRDSWDEPTDWADLATYGFYCVEAAVVAAALHVGWARPGSHRAKDNASRRLHDEHGLPSVSDLLFTLNQARKHEAYGDVARPASLDPEDVALAVEEYVGSVEALLQQ